MTHKQYALCKTTDKGFQFVTHINWIGATLPTVAKQSLGTLDEAQLFNIRQLQAIRSFSSTKELLEKNLPDFTLVEVSLSIEIVEVGDLVRTNDVNTGEEEYWFVHQIEFEDGFLKYYSDKEDGYTERKNITLIAKGKDLKYPR